jgi:hypothetical protein
VERSGGVKQVPENKSIGLAADLRRLIDGLHTRSAEEGKEGKVKCKEKEFKRKEEKKKKKATLKLED